MPLKSFLKSRKQKKQAETRTKSLKKQINERKKDVNILQRHLKGGKILATQRRRLENVLLEQGTTIRRDKDGRRIR